MPARRCGQARPAAGLGRWASSASWASLAAWAATTALALGAPLALACADSLAAPGRLLARPDSAAAQGWQLVLAPQPAPLATGRLFALDIVLCAPPDQPLPATLAVDAWMPVHRHGMSYRASVHALGGGRYRAEGLMLHMPGRWQLRFEWPAADAGQAPLKLVHELTLR